jgi:hypothetical protein
MTTIGTRRASRSRCRRDARSADPWILEVWCELRSGGRHLARRITTSAPAIGADPARVVAVGRVPGARRWEVVATAARGAIADLQLVAAEDDGGCCGVRPQNDAAELERLTFGPIPLGAAPSPFGPPLRLPLGSTAATAPRELHPRRDRRGRHDRGRNEP